jgi:hypothetical protein
MRATPFVGCRILWLAAASLVLLSATGAAHATLSPDQGNYNREQLPLIVKPPETTAGPGGHQDAPPPPGAGVPTDPGAVGTVPEPGSLLLGLLGCGAVGVAGLRRRRRRRTRETPCLPPAPAAPA